MADDRGYSLGVLVDEGFYKYNLDIKGQGVAKRWELTRWMEEGELFGEIATDCIAAATTYLACQDSDLKKPPSVKDVAKYFGVVPSTLSKVARYINDYYSTFGGYSIIIYRMRKQRKRFWYFSFSRVGTKTDEMLRHEIRLGMGLKKDLVDYVVLKDTSADWQSLSQVKFCTQIAYRLEKRRAEA